MLCGFIKVHLSSTSQRSNAPWPADYGGGGGGENVLSICKKSGPYLETPPRLEPGEPEEPWGPRTGSPGPVPLPVTVPGRGIWRVNRSKWSSAVRQSVRLGMASATAPPVRPLTTLNRVCVCVWPLPSPPTHTFPSYRPRSASLMDPILTMLMAITTQSICMFHLSKLLHGCKLTISHVSLFEPVGKPRFFSRGGANRILEMA